MRFALNYSSEAVKLFEAGKIHVDLFKMPDWEPLVDEVRQQYPVYVHFDLKVGTPQHIDWHQIERFLKQTETRHVNVHLGVWHSEVMPEADILDLSNAMIDDVMERMSRDLRDVVRRFGAENVIAENLFCLDRHGKVMQACTLPQVIHKVIEDADCGFLLDITHAQIAAFTQGIDVKDYINQLPLYRLEELHITGVGYRDDGRLGDHLPMRAIDWATFDWAMQQIHHNNHWQKPHLIVCEYGGIGDLFRPYSDETVIAEQIPRMVQAVYPEQITT